MAYNINLMPRTMDEWNELIEHYASQSLQEHDEAVAAAKARAEAAWAALPDDENRPALAAYVAQAVACIEPAWSRADWEAHFKSVGYYPQQEPVFTEPVLTAEQLRQQEIASIDAATSQAIMAGFDYAINGETYRFHYDRDDQLNFESGATGCLMKKAGAAGLPETAPVNAYKQDGSMVRLELGADDFLALYGAALAHKAACLAAGSAKKAELANAM